ncbi:CotD family spore coat protein [Bacillus sp. MUM 13]|uniref:CotD family spore coat protein n=1 Tax=Bacillus sp. MUM 13 TaxID=1678001 RepID=UPI0009F45747|nr:CotD family spore coat protein [Bacillus sp. MUM 13]
MYYHDQCHQHHAQCGPVYCPPHIAPAQEDPPIYDPAQNYVNTNIYPHIVPHIHPSHTTTVNKQVFMHQHYFPHTESCMNVCCHEHIICGPRHIPCCHPGPNWHW